MCQIFKNKVPKEILFELLEKICLKTETYYLFDNNSLKKLIYHQLYSPFVETIQPYYHYSKRFYLTRKLTYNSFTNIVRQICKSQNIEFISHKKYNESVYNIDYYIFY
jgi:hypothetical protein